MKYRTLGMIVFHRGYFKHMLIGFILVIVFCQYLNYYSFNILGARYENKTLFNLMSTPAFYLTVIIGVATILLGPYTFKVVEMVITAPEIYAEKPLPVNQDEPE